MLVLILIRYDSTHFTCDRYLGTKFVPTHVIKIDNAHCVECSSNVTITIRTIININKSGVVLDDVYNICLHWRCLNILFC